MVIRSPVRKKLEFVKNVKQKFNMTKLSEKFKKETTLALKKELGLDNVLAVPRVTKVVVNMALKEGAKDSGVIEKNKGHLMAITGQVPQTCRAKKSVAAFSLVKGSPIGLSVTLRGERMYDFLEKVFAIVLPRLRDFHGVSLGGFDGKGNYTLGIPEIMVFPEIEYTKVDKMKGLGLTLVTNSKDDKIARVLLESLGMPFAKD